MLTRMKVTAVAFASGPEGGASRLPRMLSAVKRATRVRTSAADATKVLADHVHADEEQAETQDHLTNDVCHARKVRE